MSCARWNESLTERLYGEIAPEAAAALEAHLGTCASCRATLDDFQHVRTVLRAHEPPVPNVPRVVVLSARPRVRPELLAASLLLATVLCGAGYALGTGRRAVSATDGGAAPAVTMAPTEDLVRREVDRRLAAWVGSHAGASARTPESSSGDTTAEPPVSTAALRAELAKIERRMNGARAADLDYVLDQIAASEFRVGARIGKTNQALRTVALASNPGIDEQ